MYGQKKNQVSGTWLPQTYEIIKFVVGCFGLDYLLQKEASVLDPYFEITE
jgi:hypothetical protein